MVCTVITSTGLSTSGRVDHVQSQKYTLFDCSNNEKNIFANSYGGPVWGTPLDKIMKFFVKQKFETCQTKTENSPEKEIFCHYLNIL